MNKTQGRSADPVADVLSWERGRAAQVALALIAGAQLCEDCWISARLPLLIRTCCCADPLVGVPGRFVLRSVRCVLFRLLGVEPGRAGDELKLADSISQGLHVVGREWISRWIPVGRCCSISRVCCGGGTWGFE